MTNRHPLPKTKKKFTADDWTTPVFPRKLTKTEQMIYDRGRRDGNEVGQKIGFDRGLKAGKAELELRRLEARLKLINAAGQAYDAITRAMSDDGFSIAGERTLGR